MIVAKEIFETNKFHHIPVVDEDDQLVGILSQHDYNKMLTTFSVFKNSKADLANRKFMMSMQVKDVMTDQVKKLHENGYVISDADESSGLSDEERLVGELARLQTMMMILEDKEEYEKASVIQKKIQIINKKLNDGTGKY